MAGAPLGREDVLAASRRVYRFARRTPLVRDDALSDLWDADVYLKLESEQPVRSFKIRGATNKLLHVEGSEVVASSSGNHGIAVAYVAGRLGKRATIVLPEAPNPTKLAEIRSLGADVIQKGATSEARNEFARRLAEERGAALIPPFDDPLIVAGQGTAGLEIREERPADVLVVPVGGGGLISGIATSHPEAGAPAIFGVQPAGAASMAASLAAGAVTSVPVRTRADGIAVSRPARLTFEIVRRRVRSVWTVEDEEIWKAARSLWRDSGRLVEPASAATVAGATRYRREWRPSGGPRPVVVLLISGANVADAVRAEITGA